MIERFYPSLYIDSVYGFDFRSAKKNGKKAILFDVDNTLVPHDGPADERAKGLFALLRELGFYTGIVSNNAGPRVAAFSEACGGVEYTFHSEKPKPDAYLRLIERFGVKKEEVLFFGDQLFTDIWGANNAGISSVLVKPIDRSTDIPRVMLKRWLEKPILCLYKRRVLNYD